MQAVQHDYHDSSSNKMLAWYGGAARHQAPELSIPPVDLSACAVCYNETKGVNSHGHSLGRDKGGGARPGVTPC